MRVDWTALGILGGGNVKTCCSALRVGWPLKVVLRELPGLPGPEAVDGRAGDVGEFADDGDVVDDDHDDEDGPGLSDDDFPPHWAWARWITFVLSSRNMRDSWSR